MKALVLVETKQKKTPNRYADDIQYCTVVDEKGRGVTIHLITEI